MSQESDEWLKEGESTSCWDVQRTNALNMEGVELGPNLGTGKQFNTQKERCESVVIVGADIGDKDPERPVLGMWGGGEGANISLPGA
jgi:hypothetical protein